MAAPAHPSTQLFLITTAVIKGNKLCNDQCFVGVVTVLLLFAFARPRAAHWDDGEILLFESSSTKWTWALRRGTSLLLVSCAMIYSSHHMSEEVVFRQFTCADPCSAWPTPPCGFTLEKLASSFVCARGWGGDRVKENTKCKLRRINRVDERVRRGFARESRIGENPSFESNPRLPDHQINFFLQQWRVRGGN